MFKSSIVFDENNEASESVIVNQGGSSSSKTYSIIQVLFSRAMLFPKSVLTVVGQDIPNLKVGALRDALKILDSSPEIQSLIDSYNKSDRIFTFKNGSVVEFKSYQDSQDAKSGKRDYLFINEANGITYDMYNELALRTRKQIFIDYNPNSEFWVHENLIGKVGVKFIRSDHRHNPFLEQSIRDKIEALKEIDMDLWRVYARGLTGKVEGLIFRNYQTVSDFPRDESGQVLSKFIGAGLDFGFTNDPSACVEVHLHSGELYVSELFYDYGLTNNDIAKRLEQLNFSREKEIIADSAEPKSIEEIYRHRFNIHGAKKGADSISHSIDILKRYKINILAHSTNLLKEIRGYKWATDKQGKSLNTPVDFNNHAIDALRYLALNKLAKNNSGEYHIW